YCNNKICNTDLEKINAGCLLLFNQFFGSSTSFKYHNNINIVDYIMIWLSYMLNLKKNERNKNLEYFNKIYINNDKYQTSIDKVGDCSNYKDLIDKKKYFLDISNENMSKIYNLFKILCNMYTDFDKKNPDCAKYIPKANEFVKNYQELYGDSSITEDSPYYKLLSTLSNDYDNFKKECSDANCKDIPPLQLIEKTQVTVNLSEHTSKQISKQTVETSEQSPKQSPKQSPEQTVQTVQKLEQISEVTSSSSSIGNKLFTILSIFGAIAFFLGISYKYSLFGFRKRAQKQYLREKIKNIKKRMNH
ncbi:BIR protein, partial [Plasmodium berghei]